LYANVRSVLSKIDELRHMLSVNSIDIFACSESWLSEKHHDNIVAIDGYKCFREDRQHKIGGGVAVWVKDSIQVKRCSFLHLQIFDAIALSLVSFRVVLILLYIPPDTALRNSEAVIENIINGTDEIMRTLPHYDLLLCGDLNRLNPNDVCNSFNLVNMFDKPTYGDAHLDYVLVSENLVNWLNVSEFVPIDISKVPHISLLVTPLHKFQAENCILHSVFDFRESNIVHFLSLLECVDWSFLEDANLSIDEKAQLFHDFLNETMASSIPSSIVRRTSRDKPWMTNVIKDMINKRWAAYRNRDFNVYNHLKVKIRDEIKKSKFVWTRKMTRTNLWKAVNTNIGSKSGNPILSLISQFGCLDDAVNGINEALSAVFLPSDTDFYSFKDVGSSGWYLKITPRAVLDLLNRISSGKASADLPTILYKRAAIIIAEPLSRIFNQSIRECKVPLCWKISAVSPIPKTKSPSLNELRPISVSPLPMKLLEKLVLRSMKQALLLHFGDQQFGFRPNSSTTCALISLHEHLTRFLDDGDTNGALIVTYDYSKAFDRLRGDLILDRLAVCDFPKPFLMWVKDYLSNRYQYVRIGTASSEKTLVKSGVPQGSVLGPYLFAITTGSFSVVGAECHLTKYADDTTLCFPIYKSKPNSHILLEHSNLIRWSSRMDLKVNADKCKSILISKTSNCERISLPGVCEVDSLSILGVVFDSRCSWSSHVNKVIKAASQRFYPLRLLRPSLSNANLKTIYYGLIRSLLEYCAPLLIGISITDSKRLDSVQRRFHRLLCGSECSEPCLEQLTVRRFNLSQRLLKSTMDEDHILHSCLPVLSASGRFILPPRRTVRRGKSFFLLASELYNACIQR